MKTNNLTKLYTIPNTNNLCKFLLFISLLLLLANNAMAQEAVAYFTVEATASNKYSLTFKYDNQYGSLEQSSTKTGNHTITHLYNDASYVLDKEEIYSITFDETCKNYTNEVNCNNWFQFCYNLSTINNLENIYPNITSMMYMFNGCTSLQNIDFSKVDLSNVENFTGMFEGCNLTSIKFNPNSITKPTAEYESMFENCTELTELDLRSFIVAKDNDKIENMFNYCSNLKTIYTSSQFNLSSLTSPVSLFEDCNSLKGGNGTSFNSNATSSQYARPDLPGQPGYFTLVDEQYAVLNGNTLTFYYDKQPSSHAGTVMFVKPGSSQDWVVDDNYRTLITTVVFDKSFAAARPTDMKDWFNGCNNLTTINNVVYLNTKEVTTMENLFKDCSNITELNLAYFNTYKVNNMNNMFNGCTKLETIYGGLNWYVGSATTGDDMFKNCVNLEGYAYKYKDEPETVRDGIYYAKDISYSFLSYGTIPYFKYYDSDFSILPGWRETIVLRFDNQWKTWTGIPCPIYTDNDATTSLYDILSNTYSKIPDINKITKVTFYSTFFNNNNIIFSYANWFKDLSALETIEGLTFYDYYDYNRPTLNTGVTNLSGMFKGCSSLKTLDLRLVKTENATDMTSMFEGCSNLEVIFVNNNWVIDYVTSSADMFKDCDKLIGDYGTSVKDNPTKTDRTYARLDTKEEKGFLGKGDYSINIDWHVKDQKNNKTDDVDLNYRYTVYQHAHSNPVLELHDDYTAQYEVDHWEYIISREQGITHTATGNEVVITTNPIGDFDVNAYLNLRYYTVTFYDGSTILASSSYPYGSTVDKPTLTLSNTNDHILSWTANFGDNNNETWDFENNTIVGNTDLFAIWTPIEHTVTFHNGDEKSSITVLNGHSIDQPKVEQKAGHTLRWTIAKDVTSEEWDFERVVENDLELWAQWEAIPCTVTFYNGRNIIIGSTTVPYGEIVSKPDFEASKGYNLKWQVWQQQKYTDWDFNTPIEITNLEIYAITDKIEYTITYHPENARGNNPDKYTVETDDFTLYNPTTLGDSEFTGWTGTDIKTPTLEVTIPKGSIGNREYTANWKQSFYTVTFHDGTNETSISVAHGSTIKLPNLDKPGRTLLKWTVLPDPESEEWNENDAVTFALNLYAQWKDLETKQQITPSLSDADKYISFPTDWKKFCKKQETEAILTYSLAEGSGLPINCNIFIETIEGSHKYPAKDGKVKITKLPSFPGEYACTAVFTGDEESTIPSDTIKFTLEITAARGLILQLYKNVIFVNNSSEKFETYQWYRYGEETDEKLNNGSRQYFTEPTLKGSYWALLNGKIHACYMEDQPVIVKQAEVSISTYPNPAVEGEEFTIEINNFDPDTEYSMIISNSNGNIIKKLTVTKQQTTLSLPRGFYTGALMWSGNKQSFKIIVR